MTPPRDINEALRGWRLHSLAAGHSARTITSREYTLRRLAQDVDPLTATHDDLVEWLAGLTDHRTGKPVTKSSRATYRAQVRAFYAWMHASGRREDDPAAGLPQNRIPRAHPRPLSRQEVDRLLDACSSSRAAQTRAYVLLACYEGLRVHEIAKVRGEDFHGDVLRVQGKGGLDATLPVHPKVAELAATMPQRGWWFPSPLGAKLPHVHRVSVGQAITRALDRAGIPGTPHACRHFYGTQVLAKSGGNLRVTQRAMRHADIRTTTIYTLVADEDVQHAVTSI
ncbi:putative Tyrosine recombinase xerD [Nostocoides japonicum T1-X7]|uniref:Putative Tyrosine recombinase xerD n=1 Tax=Nostocoides japonicum T1-X7 TaxID=1194083 RepID=A0A077LXX8_9MICO|nr:tyrosine-type recombinase/integrase [Tetrasphaera japonica]CCH77747.1 putative Tyrosine recombinase xerD [Tetrasphaera japonica T1-X7]